MKLLTTFTKNVRLLFRNKESAYTIIFGPILIILLVSFAFMGASDDYTVRVGTYAPVQTQLSGQTADELLAQGYAVTAYNDQESCIASVKSGQSHACIIFSDREAGNGTVPVQMYLDTSRANVAYRIADDLSGALDLQTNEIREQLAGDALTKLNAAEAAVERNIKQAQAMQERVGDIQRDLTVARDALSQISKEPMNVSLAGLRGYQLGLDQSAHIITNTSIKAMDQADRGLWRFENECPNCSDRVREEAVLARGNLSEAREKIIQHTEIKNAQLLADADELLQQANYQLARLNESLINDSEARERIGTAVSSAAEESRANTKELQQLAISLQQTKDLLAGDVADADTISKPVTVSVSSVTSTDDQLSFTYPYLLVLVIMFIGMLLASTLIVTDKTSQARFRNFTTPTSDNYHITVAFITAFILMVIEVGIILVLSKLFVPQAMFTSWSTIAIVAMTIVIFTFIGMIIGYLASTQEAAMITSISIGSILLFASNLIIPLEGMASAVQYASKFNPYLVLSELLRKSMLYGVSLQQVSRELFMLGMLCAALLIVTLMIERRMKRKYFKQDGSILAPHVPAPLALGTRQVHNEVELLDALDHMTRAEFEAIVTSNDNAIAVWAAKELRSRRLARRLRTTSKERMILQLDEHLKKHGKSIKR